MRRSRGPAGGQATCGQLLHIPVLLSEVLASLAPRPGKIYIDGTFGAGGYSRAILETADCRVIAIDRDPLALAAGEPLVRAFAPRLTLVSGRFGEMDRLAADCGAPLVNGAVLDIGVSSMQLADAARGFSFQSDGPLDMRMSGKTGGGLTAADIVNSFGEERLADVLYRFGEERRSRAIAKAIAAARAEQPITRTLELADIVARVLGGQARGGIHPATRTFQALRICVNDELGELERGLAAAERCLAPGGRLVVVTFHSLEDRIVKEFLAPRSGRAPRASRHAPAGAVEPALPPPSFRLLNTRPLTPSESERQDNPRSRTAKLRAAVRTGAAPWPPATDART